MTTRRMRSLAAVAALALFALASPLATRPASAQGAEPDTTLHDFLDSLADSTDHYFGKSAAATDTAGLDSALAYGLEHPRRPRSSLQLQAMPDFGFNRADGPVWGGWVAIGAPRALGELRGSAGYAVGPNEWLGDGRYRKSIRHDGAIWDWDIVGGRSTASMEREHPSLRLASVRALVNGKDRKHYLRVDGFETGIARVANTWHAGIRFRDQLERPLATTTTWNLFHSTLSLFDNLAATRGRAREFEYEFGIRTPYLPLSIEAKHQTASDAIGSDFEYRRYRVAVAGNFGLGRLAAAVPQVVYGRLHGGATPQQSFYLGGAHTLAQPARHLARRHRHRGRAARRDRHVRSARGPAHPASGGVSAPGRVVRRDRLGVGNRSVPRQSIPGVPGEPGLRAPGGSHVGRRVGLAGTQCMGVGSRRLADLPTRHPRPHQRHPSQLCDSDRADS